MIFKESNNNMSDFAFQMFLKKNDEVKAMQNEKTNKYVQIKEQEKISEKE